MAPAAAFIRTEAVNDAYERLMSSKVRYRAVIDTSTLGGSTGTTRNTGNDGGATLGGTAVVHCA